MPEPLLQAYLQASRRCHLGFVLHASSPGYAAESTEGALSVKSMWGGDAHYTLGHTRLLVNDGAYAILNNGRPYTVEVAPNVESFCLFFNADAVRGAWQTLTHSDAQLLELPSAKGTRFEKRLSPRPSYSVVQEDEMQELIEAIKAGHFNRVQELLKVHPELLTARSEQDPSPLLLAVYYNEPEIATYLVEQGVSVDIFEASALGLTKRAAELLDERPELVHAFGGDGFQPLGLASFFGHAELARLLLARGAEVNVASHNAQQVMPLHSAVAGRHLDIAQALLEHGADVNAVQEDGYTPLHEAAQNGQLEILLAAGADTGARKGDGQTPLDTAREAEHESIVRRLEALTTAELSSSSLAKDSD